MLGAGAAVSGVTSWAVTSADTFGSVLAISVSMASLMTRSVFALGGVDDVVGVVLSFATSGDGVASDSSGVTEVSGVVWGAG